MSRLIDADKLSEHKFTRESAKGSDYMRGWNDAIDAIVDNEPTVEIPVARWDAYCEGQKVGYEKGIEERPQEWILIAERLPDRFEAVLVTFQIPNREPIVYRAVYGSGKFDLDNGDTWNWNDPEIKAWMPLPEAYKETDNETDN